MELLRADLTEQGVTIGEYQSLDSTFLPTVFLGFEIKNQLDEKRLTIKPQFNPRRLTHFCSTAENLEPIFLYGVDLHPTEEMCGDLLSTLNEFFIRYINCEDSAQYLKEYKAHLSQYGLSCDDCYHTLRDGLYPIDLKHLPDLARNDKNLPIQDLGSMLSITKEQWYLNIGAFHIYVLGTPGAYLFN